MGTCESEFVLITLQVHHCGKTRYEIFLAEYLTTNTTEVFQLVVIYANEENAIITQQVATQVESRVHHVQPLRMEAALSVRVGAEPLPLRVDLPRVVEVGLEGLGVVVWVDEVGTCVVGGINRDHLDLPDVGRLKQFE